MGFFKKRKPAATGPDFSDIDTPAKAERAAAAGRVERILLLPTALGGDDVPQNVTYVPKGLAAAKASFDENVVATAVKAGKVRRYSADPEYQGSSFVPIRIVIRAWDPGEVTMDLALWGNALEADR